MPAARASQAVIQNAIQAAKACGMDVGEVIVTADGSVRVLAIGVQPTLPSTPEGVQAWDKATGAAS